MSPNRSTWFWRKFHLALLYATFLLYPSGVFCNNPEARHLYDDVLTNCNYLVKPLTNTSDPITVRIKLKISHLIDVVFYLRIFCVPTAMANEFVALHILNNENNFDSDEINDIMVRKDLSAYMLHISNNLPHFIQSHFKCIL